MELGALMELEREEDGLQDTKVVATGRIDFVGSNGRAAQDVGGGDEGNLYWDVVAEPQDLRLDELLDLGLDETPDLGLPLVFMVYGGVMNLGVHLLALRWKKFLALKSN
ncbi:hypothetical protein VPH35_123561 [Triticum aestivum]